MALSYSLLDVDNNPTLTSYPHVTGDSFATTSGSLVIVAIRTLCDSITEAQHYTLSGDLISSPAFIVAKLRSGSTTNCWEFYSATGTGSTDNLTINYNGSGISFAGGITDTIHVLTWEITGATGLTVSQFKTATGSSATASVTLDSTVAAGSECFYTATWQDVTDSASPGSGWTQVNQIAASQFMYAQYHPSPSGAQSGQVSNIASQDYLAIIYEIAVPGSGGTDGGFGHIPIN